MVVKVVNETRGSVLGDQIGMADSWWSRLKGLIGTDRLEPGQGLLIVPCRAVHMYGMSYPIDVAFLNTEGEVVAIYRGLAPGTRSKWHGEARCVLELPEGALGTSGTVPGDLLSWSEAA